MTKLMSEAIREYKNKIREIKKMRNREAKRTAKYEIKKLFASLGLDVNKISIDNGKHKYLTGEGEFIKKYYYEFITIRLNNKDKLVYLFSDYEGAFIITVNNCISDENHILPENYNYVSYNVCTNSDGFIFESDAGKLYKVGFVNNIDKDYYSTIVDYFANETLCCIELIKLFKEYPILEYRRLSILILLSQRHNGDFKKLPRDIAVLIAKKVYSFRYP